MYMITDNFEEIKRVLEDAVFVVIDNLMIIGLEVLQARLDSFLSTGRI